MIRTEKSDARKRLRYWRIKAAAVVILVLIGYNLPEIWPTICVIIWVTYALSLIGSSFFFAKAEKQRSDKESKLKTYTSFLGNLATAALISAPIVVGHWYRMTYFENR